MKYRAMAAFAAASVVISMQPGLSAHHRASGQSVHVTALQQGLTLDDYFTECYGCGTSSAQTMHVPIIGFVAQLIASGEAEAGTEVTGLGSIPTFMFDSIRFNLNGPTDKFFAFVEYTDPHGGFHEIEISLGHGIQKGPGSTYFITAPTIPRGSRINALEFFVDNYNGSCNTTETDNISQVYIDHSLAHIDMSGDTSICGGC